MNHDVPRTIRMQPGDNVAIVVNDGGLPAGTVLPGGLVLLEGVPQGHKVALSDLADGEPVIRYGVTIGYASGPIARGSWVSERVLRMPAARSLDDLPVGRPPSLTTMATLSPGCMRIVRGTSWFMFRLPVG